MYKIGDTVRIKSDLHACNDYQIYCAPAMAELRGKIVKINGVYNSHYDGFISYHLNDIHSFFFTSDMFTPVNKNPHFIQLSEYV